MPADARIVLSLDLARLRGAPLWKGLAKGPAKHLAPMLDDFARGTGIDLLGQARQILVAVPGARQDDDRLVLIADLGTLDQARVAAWLRQRQNATTAAFVHGPGRIVIAKGAWAAAVTALARTTNPAQGAAGDPELRGLCERAAGDHVFWLAAVVPAPLRRVLIEQVRFPDVASIARLSGSVDLDGSLRAVAVAELSNAADALGLAHRLSAFLNAAKRHPDMLAQGLAPYLEAVRFATNGPRVQATLELPAAQTDDLAPRIEALARVAWTK